MFSAPGPVSDVSAPQPGDNPRRILERLRAARLARGGNAPGAYESAFEKGTAGELRFGTALNAAATARGGCWVLHGLVAPEKRGDIDHVVIGPAGITTIDTKAWTGKVWIGRLGLGRGRRAFPHEIAGMSRQINRVHEVLARSGRDDVSVTGVLCMVNENPGIPAAGFADIRGVRIGRPNAVIHHALRDGPLDTATIEQIHRLISASFAVHGGSQAPTDRRPPRRHFPVRTARKIALALLSAMLVLTGMAALVSGLDGSVDRIAKPWHAFSREDLRAHLHEYRAIARSRAHGHVRGPKVRVSAYNFELTYRRGKHCRVVVDVPRAAPIVGGGKATASARGCARRR